MLVNCSRTENLGKHILQFSFAGIGLSALLALAAACWNLLVHSSTWHTQDFWIGLVLWGLIGTSLAFCLLCTYRRYGIRFFLPAVVLASFISQGLWLYAVPTSWANTNDALIFQSYLSQLSTHGYSQETLQQLSQNYDYRVWTRRAIPFYYSCARLGQPTSKWALRLGQALLVSLSLLLTFRIAILLFSEKTAVMAVLFQLLMPFRLVASMEINHHLLGGFYFASGLWLICEWHRPSSPRHIWTWGLLCAAVVGMRLEGGIDIVFLGGAMLVCFVLWKMQHWHFTHGLLELVLLCLLPWTIAVTTEQLLTRPISTADIHHHESGLLAFMVRGWDPKSLGEYSARLEQLDYGTPVGQKKEAMLKAFATHASNQATALAFAVFPSKIVKLFLLGYASGAEEMMRANHANKLANIFRGARIGYLLFLLVSLAIGIYTMDIYPSAIATHLTIAIPCILLIASYVFFGETSPRYSIYVQPWLFALAGQGACRTLRSPHIAIAHPFVSPQKSIPFLLLPILLWSIFFGIGRLHCVSSYDDLRSWTVIEGNNIQTHADNPATITLPVQASSKEGTVWALLAPPISKAPIHDLSLLVLSTGIPPGTTIHVTARHVDGSSDETDIFPLPSRIRLPYSQNILYEFRSTMPVVQSLTLGYAQYGQ